MAISGSGSLYSQQQLQNAFYNTTTSTTGASFSYTVGTQWYDYNTQAWFDCQMGVPVQNKPKIPTALDWLDQRVNEMRVKL